MYNPLFFFAAAASLLVSLVPNQQFRQGYRSTKIYSGQHGREVISLSPEAMTILHTVKFS